jgi:methionyl-tRNA synthetase
VLTANAPETKDNDFTWKDFQARNNNELLAVFGNFVNRTLVLTHKYFEGKVPALDHLTDADKAVLAEMQHFPEKISHSIELYRFREALSELMNLARLGNRYLTENEPWKIFKTDPDRVKTILAVSLEIVARLTVLSEPFLPFTAEKLRKMMRMGSFGWDDAASPALLVTGHQLGEAILLFEKVEDSMIELQIQKLLDTRKANEAEEEKAVKPQKAVIQFDDFTKMDLRVGTILEAEVVPKTKKLLKLLIDTGIDKRTVVSGIAEYYQPENIIGQQVVMLVNLEARKIRGIESQGMIMMAENAEGKLCFVAPSEGFMNGAEVK